MKYLVLLYDNPNVRDTITPEAMAQMQALLTVITDSGELLSTAALADPARTKTLRTTDGLPAVTDGPFAEAKEYMGGFLMLDVETEQRAIDIMAQWPDGLAAAIEIRPLMHEGGADT